MKTNSLIYLLWILVSLFLGCVGSTKIQEAKLFEELNEEINREYDIYFNGSIHEAKAAVENVASILIKCEKIDSGSRTEPILLSKIIQKLRMSRILKFLGQDELSRNYFDQAMVLSSNHSAVSQLSEIERRIEINRLMEGIDALHHNGKIITPEFLKSFK